MNPKIGNDCTGYADWLECFPWEFFCTLTTGYALSMPAARRMMGAYFRKMAQKGPCTMFWVAEPFDTKEGYHTHALVRTPPAMWYREMGQLWQAVSNPPPGKKHRVHFLQYDRERGAGRYVSKYITKARADYDLLQKQ